MGLVVAPAAAFHQKSTGGEHLWRATAQERLLRETGIEAGLLFNGSQLRLVVAPKGESSGHLTFRLADLAEVSGRLMVSGPGSAAGAEPCVPRSRWHPPGGCAQEEPQLPGCCQHCPGRSGAGGAVWDLLRGFQHPDALSRRQNQDLLGDLPEPDQHQLYGGLITVLCSCATPKTTR